MADLYPVSPEMEAEWAAWGADRPQVIKDLVARFRPWKLYRLISTGHRVFTYSFSEDNTVTVVVTGKYNRVVMDRRVFGISPDDLVECDLPAEGEALGTQYEPGSDEELVFINRRRAELGNPSLSREEANEMSNDDDCALEDKPE